MTIQTLLVALAGTEGDADALASGFAIASRFQAHLDAVHVRIDPAARFQGLRAQEGWRVLVTEVEAVRTLEAEAERGAAEARRRFEEAAAAAGAPVVEGAGEPRQLSAGFREVGGGEGVLAEEGRLADLLVFALATFASQPRGYLLFEAALLGSGRPLLVVPPGAGREIGGRVAVAWNGDVHVARAVAGALPLLDRADAVHVLTVPADDIDARGGRRLAAYLARRGIAAEAAAPPPGPGPVGQLVLGRATELGCDLLVMGGYGHSRFREVVLGGTTRHVLDRTRLPVLIAH